VGGDRLGSGGGHGVTLGMHAMRSQVFGPHRLEGAGADMERHVGDGDAGFPQHSEEFVIKVQSGGGCGHRPFFAGEHRLVAGLITGFRNPFDVGRQRQAAMALDQFGGVARKTQSIKLAFATEYLDLERVFELQPAARLG
jgi:hypothetical protein